MEPYHTTEFRKRHLGAQENVLESVAGYKGKWGRGPAFGDDRQVDGALIVTNQRVAFYRKGILGEVLETIPLEKITSVEQRSVLGHRTLRLHTSHDQLEFKSIDKAGYEAVVVAIERHRHSTPLGHGQSRSVESPTEILKRLGELRDQGILSQQEFEVKKKQLLDRI